MKRNSIKHAMIFAVTFIGALLSGFGTFGLFGAAWSLMSGAVFLITGTCAGMMLRRS